MLFLEWEPLNPACSPSWLTEISQEDTLFLRDLSPLPSLSWMSIIFIFSCSQGVFYFYSSLWKLYNHDHPALFKMSRHSAWLSPNFSTSTSIKVIILAVIAFIVTETANNISIMMTQRTVLAEREWTARALFRYWELKPVKDINVLAVVKCGHLQLMAVLICWMFLKIMAGKKNVCINDCGKNLNVFLMLGLESN